MQGDENKTKSVDVENNLSNLNKAMELVETDKHFVREQCLLKLCKKVAKNFVYVYSSDKWS